MGGSAQKSVVPAAAGTHAELAATRLYSSRAIHKLSMGPRLRGDDVVTLVLRFAYRGCAERAPRDR
ncbi:hypothetical protein GCM10027321_45470 [Massilia terrae]